jgi:uncharacterized protein YbjT (DUF2867 family)
MARVLIVGCGCRGRAFARDLAGDGYAVRGTTRDADNVGGIEAAGAEAVVCDPNELGTVLPALEGVTFVAWLLGSARGEGADELHGTRLERLFEELVDTPVRGVVYEAVGSVPAPVLAGGAAIAQAAQERWRIPVVLLEADPRDPAVWGEAARSSVGALLRR